MAGTVVSGKRARYMFNTRQLLIPKFSICMARQSNLTSYRTAGNYKLQIYTTDSVVEEAVRDIESVTYLTGSSSCRSKAYFR